MAIRTAKAQWDGNLQQGRGTMSFGSGAWSGQYSFQSRFEEGAGTNPEELIGAAHAGCFSMALSAQLDTAGKKAESIQTEATVTLDKTDAGFTITAVHLKVRAKVPGASPPDFQAAAENAKKGCPVSRVLNAQITMETKLEGWT
jgi:osmotically inducible protein OsmC